MRALLLLLLVVGMGCPGTAGPGTRRRPDSRPAFPDATVGGWPSPTPTPSADSSAPVQPAPPPAQPDATPAPPQQPAPPSCTQAGGACGGGQPGCCSGSICVSFQSAVCAKTCASNGECPTNCCVGTTQGVSVCADPAYCPAPPAPTPPPAPPPPAPAANSCQGLCGGQAPAGCYCDYICIGYFDCCPDFFARCF